MSALRGQCQDTPRARFAPRPGLTFARDSDLMDEWSSGMVISNCKLNQPLRFPGRVPRLLWVGGFLAVLVTGALAEPYAFTTAAGRAGIYGSGDGTNGNAQFTSPQAVAVDGLGSLYVAENIDHTIRRITPQGTNWVVSTIAGFVGLAGASDGTNSNALFNQPAGVAVNSAGSIFVADTGNHTIRKVVRGHPNTNWVVTTIAGAAGNPGSADGQNSSAQFNAPTGIAVDGADNLYVADYANNTVRKLTPVGTNWVVSTLAGLAGANQSGSADGTNSSARFYGPAGVALDGATNVFITDSLNHTIRRLSLLGTNWVVTTLAGLKTVAGSADGSNSSARFSYPAGIAVDTATNFYVADSANNSIRKGVPSGTNWLVSTVAGLAGLPNYGSSDGFGTGARFWNPQGVTADKSGNVYVADTWNATIRAGKVALALQIAVSAGYVMLSWPPQATNYVLESSSSVSPGSSWLPITTGIASNANGFAYTNAISGPRTFYRLRQ